MSCIMLEEEQYVYCAKVFNHFRMKSYFVKYDVNDLDEIFRASFGWNVKAYSQRYSEKIDHDEQRRIFSFKKTYESIYKRVKFFYVIDEKESKNEIDEPDCLESFQCIKFIDCIIYQCSDAKGFRESYECERLNRFRKDLLEYVIGGYYEINNMKWTW